MSYELLVTSWKLESTNWNSTVRGQIHEFKFASLYSWLTSLTLRVTSLNSRVTSSNSQATSSNSRVTSSNLQVSSLNLQATTSNPWLQIDNSVFADNLVFYCEIYWL